MFDQLFTGRRTVQRHVAAPMSEHAYAISTTVRIKVQRAPR